jgi:2-dehydro-3-deoxyphosphogluconate aldolase/(4S)-4-hydroxy-2-oxoglutarate aldolase
VNFFDCLRATRLVPVADIVSAPDAVPLARALLEADLPCVEITFRTAAAVDAIRAVATEVPEVLVGAGTVRTLEQVDKAVAAGARFLVSPGLNEQVVLHAHELGVPIMPGVCTATEVEQALGLGLKLLKFFPAEAAGGVAYLKALAGPYGDVQFVPTGGIGPENLASYLDQRNVVACGGSWMVSPALISSGNLAAVTALSAEALAIASLAKRAAA